MLRSFVKCQKDECAMANIQNNTYLCGMSSHKFLFITSAVTSTHRQSMSANQAAGPPMSFPTQSPESVLVRYVSAKPQIS